MKARVFITLWSLALLIGALALGDGLGTVAGLVALGLVFVDGYTRFVGGRSFDDQEGQSRG